MGNRWSPPLPFTAVEEPAGEDTAIGAMASPPRQEDTHEPAEAETMMEPEDQAITQTSLTQEFEAAADDQDISSTLASEPMQQEEMQVEENSNEFATTSAADPTIQLESEIMEAEVHGKTPTAPPEQFHDEVQEVTSAEFPSEPIQPEAMRVDDSKLNEPAMNVQPTELETKIPTKSPSAEISKTAAIVQAISSAPVPSDSVQHEEMQVDGIKLNADQSTKPDTKIMEREDHSNTQKASTEESKAPIQQDKMQVDDSPSKAPTTTTTSAPSNTSIHRDVSFLTPSQREDLCCLQLRFSFETEVFYNVYPDVLKAGWVYQADRAMYLPPDTSTEDALTAKEVAQHLDYYSLAGTSLSDLATPHYSSKPLPRLLVGIKNKDSKQEQERWRKLREDVLYHHYIRLLRRTNHSMEPNESDRHSKDKDAAVSSKTTTTARPRRNQPARQARNNASATEADPGAGLYLDKKNIQAKEKGRRKSLNALRQEQQFASQQELAPFERLSLEECIAKGKEDYSNLQEVQESEATYKAQFKDWRFLLATNHSLLLYGFGSKRHLLNEFANQELSKEGYALVLEGFDPEISIAAILDLLVQLFLQGREPEPLRPCLPGYQDEESTKVQEREDPRGQLFQRGRRKLRDPLQRARAIAQAIATAPRDNSQPLHPLFLVLHNLEGFRSRLDQEILSTLVAYGKTNHNVPVLRLVASMDHVDAPAVLWNENTSVQFRWMWKEVHTYRPYTDELQLLAPDEIQTATSASRAKRRQSRGTAVEGKGGDRLVEVLNSLAARYTEVMQNLAALQMDQRTTTGGGTTNANKQWIDFALLLSTCLNKCTVKSENQLRTFLVELEEQDLMAVQKQGSTAVNVRIPYSEEKLQEILALQRNKN